jgi:CDP-diacylglycerol pyrophosphatase
METGKDEIDRVETQSADNDSGFIRRDFIKLSGAAVTAGLAGLGAGDALAGNQQWPRGQPSACTDSTAWCDQKTYRPTLCGDTRDTDTLWVKAQGCVNNPDPSCRAVTGSNGDYVVVNGYVKGNDYLLLALCRVTGIECPMLWQSGAPNYWNGAREGAKLNDPKNPVTLRSPFGFGVNSKNARSYQQFHIHMAPLLKSPVNIMDQLAKVHNQIGAKPEKWLDTVITIEGMEQKPGTKPPVYERRVRPYRALWVHTLDENLFTLLYDYIAKPLGAQEKVDPADVMAFENLIVIPVAAPNSGYYVLNSDRKLKDPATGKIPGIGSIDQLFYWGT